MLRVHEVSDGLERTDRIVEEEEVRAVDNGRSCRAEPAPSGRGRNTGVNGEPDIFGLLNEFLQAVVIDLLGACISGHATIIAMRGRATRVASTLYPRELVVFSPGGRGKYLGKRAEFETLSIIRGVD